jgi:uncharacterized membrane protein
VLTTLCKKLPPLKGSARNWHFLALALVVIGVTFGMASAVRTGSILVSIGGALYTYSSYTSSATKRTIELLVPTALTILLFLVSLTLPHAK